MKGLFIPEITAEMFRSGCLESIEELMAEGEIYDIEYSRWVPVSERSPFVGIDVLICDIEGTIYLSHRTYLDDYFDECGNKIKDIRAWMPLPKPHEPQESEDV